MATHTLQRTARASAAPGPRPLRQVRGLPTRVEWRRQPAAFRTSDGNTLVLIGVRKGCCGKCRFGTRWETLWGPDSGAAVRISWCESCFNASYVDATPTTRQLRHWQRLHERIRAGSLVHYGDSARRIIAELQRRGLL